jgi:hypothetical protein
MRAQAQASDPMVDIGKPGGPSVQGILDGDWPSTKLGPAFADDDIEPWDRKAKLAIEGMGPSPVAEKLELYERHYDQWREEPTLFHEALEDPDNPLLLRSLVKVFRNSLLFLAAGVTRIVSAEYEIPFRIFRQEVEELALAHAKALSDLKAATVRESFYAHYLKMVEENRQLRSFLIGHFPAYVETADSLKIPMIEIAKRVMLDQRGGAEAPHEMGLEGQGPSIGLGSLADNLQSESGEDGGANAGR